MEGNAGNFTDKTRVLGIRPLRSLRPVFPSGNQAPPFVCAPPFGPFPPGFSPFYPFSSSQANQHTPDLNQAQYLPQHQHPQNTPAQYQQSQDPSEPAVVAPLGSFRSPDTSNGNTEPEGSTVKRKIPKKRPIARPGN